MSEIDNDPIHDHILNAKGVTSAVKVDGEVIGHILLLDYDDGSSSFNRLMRDCKDMPGLTAVFESSPGSWHVWNTSVRSFDGAALTMLSCKCDPMHISVGYRRNKWTLRYGPKTTVNAGEGDTVDDLDDEYKSAPEPLSFWANETDMPQSLPHIKLIEERFGHDEIKYSRLRNVIGTDKEISAYRTMSDELKEDIHG